MAKRGGVAAGVSPAGSLGSAPAKTARAADTATTTSEILLGSHMSIGGGAHRAIERACSIESTAMQIFVKNNMQWFARPFTREEIRAFLEHAQRNKLAAVFAHANYLINLAATNPQFYANSIRALSEELTRADQLALPFIVLHPGAHLGVGEEAGLEKVVSSIDEIFARIPKVKTRIALETTAGQGSCLGHTFEQLAHIIANVREPERLCVCLDTAHVFAAGHDLTNEAGTKKNVSRIQSHRRPRTSRRVALERLEERARLPGRSSRAHWERADWSGSVSRHHARPAFPQNPEGIGNTERQRAARRRGEHDDAPWPCQRAPAWMSLLQL